MEEPTITLKSTNNGRKSSKKIFLVILVFFVLIGLVFGLTRIMGSKTKSETAKISPTPTDFVFPTDTPTPTGKTTPAPTGTKETPTPTKAGSIDKRTGLDRSELNVSIENGSGTVGAASKMSDALKDLGYHVVSVGNANNFDYQNVSISVKSKFSKYLPILKSDLSSDYTIGITSQDLDSSSSADAVIIIGQ